ncbi:DUF2919 domain-containing protein [Franconibacter helveticus]|uniref:DUF2919 domain-containing protein n=1 Tax=Franconibacter helveticus TaxID=357240 RepID=UPI000DA1F188|nr:DUF2919 domain-containing protein [Franconibacter helveticus]MDU6926022.1 DUF2919 domain-containing protein [Franconibacter helveticus]
MFLPSDYDGKGMLKPPALFWAVLLLQARTWALFVLAGASREQGEALLALFYPDRAAFWLGLLTGIPAALAFLLSGRRERFPRLWRAWRWVLIATQTWLLALQLFMLMSNEASGAAAAALLAADFFALWWLGFNARLRACFMTQGD